LKKMVLQQKLMIKIKSFRKRIKRVRQSKEGSEGQGGIDYELLSQLEDQKKQLIESHGKEAKQTAKPSPANAEGMFSKAVEDKSLLKENLLQ